MSQVHTMVGSGGSAYAYIAVTYPEGSICTCTQGSKTLTAADTSGSYIFAVPNDGTWVVSCTDGTETKSANVGITTHYQTETITLSYKIYLYSYGNTYDSVSGGWEGVNIAIGGNYSTGEIPTLIYNDNNIQFKLPGAWRSPAIQHVNYIDVTNINTLHYCISGSSGYGYCRMQIRIYNKSGTLLSTVEKSSWSTYEEDLDVTDLTGEVRCVICGGAHSSYGGNMYLYELYFYNT